MCQNKWLWIIAILSVGLLPGAVLGQVPSSPLGSLLLVDLPPVDVPPDTYHKIDLVLWPLSTEAQAAWDEYLSDSPPPNTTPTPSYTVNPTISTFDFELYFQLTEEMTAAVFRTALISCRNELKSRHFLFLSSALEYTTLYGNVWIDLDNAYQPMAHECRWVLNEHIFFVAGYGAGHLEAGNVHDDINTLNDWFDAWEYPLLTGWRLTAKYGKYWGANGEMVMSNSRIHRQTRLAWSCDETRHGQFPPAVLLHHLEYYDWTKSRVYGEPIQPTEEWIPMDINVTLYRWSVQAEAAFPYFYFDGNFPLGVRLEKQHEFEVIKRNQQHYRSRIKWLQKGWQYNPPEYLEGELGFGDAFYRYAQGETAATDPTNNSLVVGDDYCDERWGENSTNSTDCYYGDGFCSVEEGADPESYPNDCVPPEVAAGEDGWCQRGLGENALTTPGDCYGTLWDTVCSRDEGEDGRQYINNIANPAYDPACDSTANNGVGTYVGDGTCQYWEGENIWNAPGDCCPNGDCVTWLSSDPLITVDGVCETWMGENPMNSPIDCHPDDPALAMIFIYDLDPVPTSAVPAKTITFGDDDSIQVLAKESSENTDVSDDVIWGSSKQELTTVGDTLDLDSLVVGYHVITMTLNFGDDGSYMRWFVVEVDAVPTVTLGTWPSSAYYAASNVLTASATSAPRGDISASMTWFEVTVVNNEEVLTPLGGGASFNTSTLPIGAHLIRVVATNQAGTSTFDEESITILNNPPVITITTWTQPVTTTGTVYLAGTVTDVEDGNISSSLEWRDASSNYLYATGASVNFASTLLGFETTPDLNQLVAKVTDSHSATTTTDPHWITVYDGSSGTLTAGEIYLDTASETAISFTESGSSGGVYPVTLQLERCLTGTANWAAVGDPNDLSDDTVTAMATYDYRIKYYDGQFTPAVVYTGALTASAVNPQPVVQTVASVRTISSVDYGIPFYDFSVTNAAGTTTIPVECRNGGVTKILVTFDAAIAPSDGTWGSTGGTEEVTVTGGTVSSYSSSSNVLTINLTTSTPHGSCLALALTGIELASGTTSPIFDVTYYIKVLEGDMDGDGEVEEGMGGDDREIVAALCSETFPGPNGDSFRGDGNCSGEFNSGDVTFVNSHGAYSYTPSCVPE